MKVSTVDLSMITADSPAWLESVHWCVAHDESGVDNAMRDRDDQDPEDGGEFFGYTTNAGEFRAWPNVVGAFVEAVIQIPTGDGTAFSQTVSTPGLWAIELPHGEFASGSDYLRDHVLPDQHAMLINMLRKLSVTIAWHSFPTMIEWRA